MEMEHRQEVRRRKAVWELSDCTAKSFRGANRHVCSSCVYPCGKLNCWKLSVCVCRCMRLYSMWVGGYSMCDKVCGSQKFGEKQQKHKLETVFKSIWNNFYFLFFFVIQPHTLRYQPGFCLTWPSLKREAKSSGNMMSSLNKTCWSEAIVLCWRNDLIVLKGEKNLLLATKRF